MQQLVMLDARRGHANTSTPMAIQIVREPITLDEMRSLARGQFGDFVKAVVDVRPSQGNRSRSVEDPALRHQIVNVVTGLIGA